MKIIIDFDDDLGKMQIKNTLKEIGATNIEELDVDKKIFACEVFDKPENTEMFVCRSDKMVNAVLSNYDIRDIKFDDPDNWWLNAVTPRIEDGQDWQMKMNAAKEVIYLIDTGIKTDLSEFESRDVLASWSFDEDLEDDTGHGSMMASIMVGKTSGITNAIIKSVKVFDKDGNTSISDLLRAIKWIIEDKKKNHPNGICLVNCSWVTQYDEILKKAFSRLTENRLVVVAAAGQTLQSCDNLIPAGLPNVITVSGFTTMFEPVKKANWGTSIDYYAPGQKIKVQKLDGSYRHIAGTSAAAAIASGSIANFLGMTLRFNYDDLTISEVHEILNMQVSLFGQLSLMDNYMDTKNRIFPNPGLLYKPSLIKTGLSILGIFESGENIKLKLFHEEEVDEKEYNDLPEGLSIVDGYLVGTFEDVPEPSYITFNVGLSNKFGGMKEYYDLVVVPKGHTMEPETLSNLLEEEIVVADSRDKILQYMLVKKEKE